MLPRRRRQYSAHGGVGGAERWRRVVAVDAKADVPGTASWLGVRALPGGGGVHAAWDGRGGRSLGAVALRCGGCYGGVGRGAGCA